MGRQYTCHSPDYERDLIDRVAKLLLTPVKIGDDWVVIKSDAQTGWNWGKVKTDKEGKVIANEFGLRDYSGEDRREAPKEFSLLDRRVRDIHRVF